MMEIFHDSKKNEQEMTARWDAKEEKMAARWDAKEEHMAARFDALIRCFSKQSKKTNGTHLLHCF